MNDTTATGAIPVKPKLSRRLRMQWEPAQDSYVLLYPEGMIKLYQGAGEILKRCAGERTSPPSPKATAMACGLWWA